MARKEYEREEILDHLRSLADAARKFWWHADVYNEKGFSAEDYFEMELVRAEGLLEEVDGDADL